MRRLHDDGRAARRKERLSAGIPIGPELGLALDKLARDLDIAPP